MDFDVKTAGWYFVVFIFSALFFLQHARTAISWAIDQWQWFKYVCYLRGLPSPPRHWLLGHIAEVSTVQLTANHSLVTPVGARRKVDTVSYQIS